jgi:hypothetical protein
MNARPIARSSAGKPVRSSILCSATLVAAKSYSEEAAKKSSQSAPAPTPQTDGSPCVRLRGDAMPIGPAQSLLQTVLHNFCDVTAAEPTADDGVAASRDSGCRLSGVLGLTNRRRAGGDGMRYDLQPSATRGTMRGVRSRTNVDSRVAINCST